MGERRQALAMLRHLVAANVRAQLEYRASFALDLIGTALFALLDLAAILVIFHNVPELGDWKLAEVMFLYATAMLSFALADLAVGQLDQLPAMIRTGTFDVVLVRPRGSLLQVVASDFRLRRLGQALTASVVLAYAVAAAGFDLTVDRIALLAATVLSGAVIFASVWIVASCAVFWTVEGSELVNAFTSGGLLLAQYPIDVYSGWLRRLFAYVVPIAFVAYLPALHILGKEDPVGLPEALRFASPAVALAAACAAGLAWRAAVRHYRSAGG